MKNLKALAFNLGVLAFAVLLVFALTVGLASISGNFAFANTVTSNIVASVNVPAVCGISLGASTINFGAIVPGSNVPTANAITDNNIGGDINANVLVSGTDWTYGSGTVGNTLYSPTSQATYTGTSLTGSLVPTSVWIGAGAANSLYFGLGIPIGTLAGSYTQTITIENSC